MTRDEAREILQKDGCGYGCFIPSRKNCNSTDCLLKEAVTMAIKALEQQTCEDSVSRQAVFDVIDDIDKTTCMNEYHVIVDAIDKLPSVNPQPICEEREKGECPYYAG